MGSEIDPVGGTCLFPGGDKDDYEFRIVQNPPLLGVSWPILTEGHKLVSINVPLSQNDKRLK